MVTLKRRWLLYATCATTWCLAVPVLGKAANAVEYKQEFINVSGQVLSADGTAVAGATILYGGAEASADQNGRFSIANVEKSFRRIIRV